MADDFRRYLRRPVKVEFQIRDANDTRAGEIMFDAVDISEGGAFLRSDYLLEVGDRVHVSFRLPNHEAPLDLLARVAWVTRNHQIKGEAGMGLEFVDLPELERRVIAEYVGDQKLQLAAQTP